MKNLLLIRIRLTFLFHRMCNEAGIPSPLSVVRFDKRQNLNATLHLPNQILSLPVYDLYHLSKNDIKALLAHEVGHLAYYKKHFRSIDWDSLEIGIISLIFVAIALLIGKNHPMWIWALAICTGFPIPFFFKASEAQIECKADVIGANIIGYPKMIHLMITANNYEVDQYNLLRRYAKALWTCPLAEFHILLLMFHFRLYWFLRMIHGTLHPSYAYRIKYLRKHRQSQDLN